MLAAGSLLVMLPAALAGLNCCGFAWYRWPPETFLATAAVVGLRFRQAHDRHLEIGLAAAGLTLGITGVLVQVGLLAAAACLVLIAPLSAGAMLWRARHAPGSGPGWVGLRHLRPGRAAWPAAVRAAAMGIVAVGLALIGVVSGPLPTLALTALLLLGVAAATLRLVLPAFDARAAVAVLVALAIAAVPFRGVAEIQVSGIAFGASDLLLLGALAAWIFGRDARDRATVPTYALGLLIFAGWLMVTALAAANLAPVLKEVLKWLQIAVALVILADLMREPSGRRIVAWAVGAAVLLQAGLGLVQTAAAAGPGGFVVGGVLRAYGTFDQPNPYGGYLGIHLPLILAAAIYARGSRRRWLVRAGHRRSGGHCGQPVQGRVARRGREFAGGGVDGRSADFAASARRVGPGRRGGAGRLACTPRRGV